MKFDLLTYIVSDVVVLSGLWVLLTSLLSLPTCHLYQIGDADNEAEKISPDEDAEKQDGNKTSGREKTDNREADKAGQKKQETSAKVKIKQSDSGMFL